IGSSTCQDWYKAGNGYKASLIHKHLQKPAIFISRIENDECFIDIYHDCKLYKTFREATPDRVWKMSKLIQKFSGKQYLKQKNNHIIEIYSELELLYSPKYEFSERKLGAWQSMLCVSGCANITPWPKNESK
ncbi:3014_t:CDS:2, partial [Cetraspora pellucida]